MVATTFLTGSEPRDVNDRDDLIAPLIDEVSRRTRRDWFLTYRTVPVYGWRRRVTKSRRRYELYVYVGGMGPYQIITAVTTYQEAYCYLLGVLSGLDTSKP